MSDDQNKGPIYGVDLPAELPHKVPTYHVDLPAELPLGANGWTQVVPRRDELEQVRKRVGDRTVAALEVALKNCASLSQQLLESTANYAKSLDELLDRSGFDLSQCMHCGCAVICIPDGLPCCKPCAEKVGGE
jgi:hypothetical protein